MRLLIIIFSVAVFLPSCKDPETKNTTTAVPERRVVSPRAIDLAGISFSQTPITLKEKLSALQCDRKDKYIEICQWKTTEKDRNDSYPGVEQMKFTFFQDTLQNWPVQKRASALNPRQLFQPVLRLPFYRFIRVFIPAFWWKI